MFASKYRQLSDGIADYIRTENITGKLPGVRVLAELFHVNKITVNRALHELEKRGTVTIRRNSGAYVLPASAKNSYTFGVIGLNENRLTEGFLQWMTEHSGDPEYRYVGLYCDFEKNLPLLKQLSMDGYIFLGSYGSETIFNYLHENHIPAVGGLLFKLPWLGCVTYDHQDGYRRLIRYLQELGHRKIAYVDSVREVKFRPFTDMLEQIFREELKENFDPECFCIVKWKSWEKEDYPWKLYRKWQSLSEPPTAIVGPSPWMLTLCHRLEEHGVRVPQDISIAMIGNHHDCLREFTSLEGRVDKLIFAASKRIAELIRHEASPEPWVKYVPMVLKAGKTTAPLSCNLSPPDEKQIQTH